MKQKQNEKQREETVVAKGRESGRAGVGGWG